VGDAQRDAPGPAQAQDEFHGFGPFQDKSDLDGKFFGPSAGIGLQIGRKHPQVLLQVVKTNDSLVQRRPGKIGQQLQKAPEMSPAGSRSLGAVHPVERAMAVDEQIAAPIMAVPVEMIKPPVHCRDHGQYFAPRVAPGHGVQLAADVAGHPDDVFHQPRHVLEYVMVDALQDIIGAAFFLCFY
jgi:hypothetical protein